jgi:hypothetical protein
LRLQGVLHNPWRKDFATGVQAGSRQGLWIERVCVWDRGIDEGGIDKGGIDEGGIDNGGIDNGGIDGILRATIGVAPRAILSASDKSRKGQQNPYSTHPSILPQRREMRRENYSGSLPSTP